MSVSATQGGGHPHGLGLPKRLRIRLRRDYRRVQGRGQKLRQGSLLCLFLPGAGPHSRIGITVSRKVGNAVNRNRVKRWLREAIRHERGVLQGPWDVVFIAHPKAAQASAADIRSDVGALLARISTTPRRRAGRVRR